MNNEFNITNKFKIAKENDLFVIRDVDNEIAKVFNSYYKAITYYEELSSGKIKYVKSNKELNHLLWHLENKISKVLDERNSKHNNDLFLNKALSDNQHLNKRIDELTEVVNNIFNFAKDKQDTLDLKRTNEFVDEKIEKLSETIQLIKNSQKAFVDKQNQQNQQNQIASSFNKIEDKINFLENNDVLKNLEKQILDKVSLSLETIKTSQKTTFETQNQQNQESLVKFEEKLNQIASSFNKIEDKINSLENNDVLKNLEKQILDKVSLSFETIKTSQKTTFETQNQQNQESLVKFEEKLNQIASSFNKIEDKINSLENNDVLKNLEKQILDKVSLSFETIKTSQKTTFETQNQQNQEGLVKFEEKLNQIASSFNKIEDKINSLENNDVLKKNILDEMGTSLNEIEIKTQQILSAKPKSISSLRNIEKQPVSKISKTFTKKTELNQNSPIETKKTVIEFSNLTNIKNEELIKKEPVLIINKTKEINNLGSDSIVKIRRTTKKRIQKNKKDIILMTSEKTLDQSIDKKILAKKVDEIFKVITSELSEGNEVAIPGFGKLVNISKAVREGINPLTGEKISIEASTTSKLKSSKVLKEAMNSFEPKNTPIERKEMEIELSKFRPATDEVIEGFSELTNSKNEELIEKQSVSKVLDSDKSQVEVSSGNLNIEEEYRLLKLDDTIEKFLETIAIK